MELIREHEIRRFEAGRPTAAADKIIAEARVEVDINDGRHRLAVLCLPEELEALAVGLLLSEGALRRRQDLAAVQAFPHEGRVLVWGNLDADVLAGIAGRVAPDLHAAPPAAIGAGPVVTPETLHELARAFQARARLWPQTGGVHACALARGEELVLFVEDVGRHNAFEKIVGRAFLDGIELADKLVLSTGRLSGEIVSKAAACGVPMLVSRSAVTSLAVDLARRSGLTLVGFLRGRRFNVYTGSERIAAGGPKETGK